MSKDNKVEIVNSIFILKKAGIISLSYATREEAEKANVFDWEIVEIGLPGSINAYKDL